MSKLMTTASTRTHLRFLVAFSGVGLHSLASPWADFFGLLLLCIAGFLFQPGATLREEWTRPLPRWVVVFTPGLAAVIIVSGVTGFTNRMNTIFDSHPAIREIAALLLVAMLIVGYVRELLRDRSSEPRLT